MKNKKLILIFLFGFILNIATPFSVSSSTQDTIHYLGDENYPPFEFINDNGKPDGFNIALFKKLAGTLNYQYTINLIPWYRVVDSLENGTKKYVTSMFVSDKRKEHYLFSTPHNQVSLALFVLHDSDISKFEDIQDKTILVVRRDVVFEFIQDFHTTGNVKRYKNYIEALNALEKREGDAVICPNIQGHYIIQNNNFSGITSLEIPFPLLEYCFCTTHDNKYIKTIMNEGLLMLNQSGEYDRIYKKWYSTYAEPDFIVFLKKWLLPAILLLTGLLVLVLTWVYSLRQRVRKKTLDLRLELHQRKLAEQSLKHAKEKAEESDKLKSAFLSNMNHEIRTPLNSIMGFSELLLDNTDKDDLRREQLEIIHKSSDQLLSIIENIINISKIEAGQIKLKKTKIRLHILLSDMKKLFEHKAQNKGLNFQLKLPDNADDFWITTDENKLKQTITNLLDNAFKYTDKGEISFGYKRMNAYLEFFVKDTGCGIPKDKHKQIFERFVQVSDNTNKSYFGSGLGLSIAKAYVEMLEGDIHVDSEPGKGSIFTFTIHPKEMMKIENPTDARQINEIQKLKDKRILIAEDIIDNYIYIRESLKKYKVECVHACNGEKAFKYVQQENFDAVLMDLKMPVLNGFESLEKIRKLKPRLPIIALTAYV
jgi:signal transduction histidine kinase